MTWEPKFKVGDFIYFRDKISKITSINKTNIRADADYKLDGRPEDLSLVEDGLYKSHCKIDHTGQKRVNVIIQPAMATENDEYYECPPPYTVKGGYHKSHLKLKSKKSKNRKSKSSKSSKSSKHPKNVKRNKKTKKNMKKMKGVDIKYDNDIKNKFETNHKLNIKMINNAIISDIDADYIIQDPNISDKYIKEKIFLTLRNKIKFTIITRDQIDYQIRLENDENLYKYTNIQPSSSEFSTLPDNCIAIILHFTLDQLKKYIFPNSDEN